MDWSLLLNSSPVQIQRSLEQFRKLQSDINRTKAEHTDYLTARVEALEHNQGRLLLFIVSLIEMAKQKQLFSETEFQQLVQRIDQWDQKPDGRLAPEYDPNMQQAEQPKSLYQTLYELKSAPQIPPQEYLAQLEQEAEGLDPPE